MIILDPTAISDATCSRASANGTYWDANGDLQTAPADTLRVTYDPDDLTKPARALIEPEARNEIRNSAATGGGPGDWPAYWNYGSGTTGIVPTCEGTPTIDEVTYCDIRWSGTPPVNSAMSLSFDLGGIALSGPAETWAGSVYASVLEGNASELRSIELVLGEYNGGTWIRETHGPEIKGLLSSEIQRFEFSAVTQSSTLNSVRLIFWMEVTGGIPLNFVLRFALPQIERGTKATSPIPTTGAAATRAADLISPAGTVLYSNVVENDAPTYAPGTYAAGNKVISDHVIYESKVDGNTAAPTDATKWVKIGSTNQRKMVDDRNNTQTEMADEIVLVMTPRQISQSLYLGGLDANEVSVVMQDEVEGIVYSETRSLVISDSASSFFNWCFKRIRRKKYFFTGQLPPYANAVVTITIKKQGGIARCGMCCLGPLVDVGLSKYGLSTEIKDFSTTEFKFDGTSDTTVRGFAKRMSLDVEIDNDRVDSVEEQLIDFRQKVVVFVGTVLFGSAIVCGRYSSFKKVIPGPRKSQMALQIEGTV